MPDETVVYLPERGSPKGERPELPPLPIVPLGRLDGRYFFFDPLGELREFPEARLGAFSAQADLFAGDMSYLRAAWPRFDRNGEPSGHNREMACAGLMAMCAEAGLWDPETPIRGRGVWLLPDGRILCHSGDRLHVGNDDPLRAGIRLSQAVYPRKPNVLSPAVEAASAVQVREWKRDFTWWRFAPLGLGGVLDDRGPDGLGGELLYCALCLALLGAAPSWRVHVFVRGAQGSGKSTLSSFALAALGGQGVTMNNFTEPGFRHTLANEARAIWLDEAEGDETSQAGGATQAVIRVIRQMSGGEGVKGARGGADGIARHFEIAGCVFLSCINLPPLLPQDLARLLMLELLPSPASHEAPARLAIARAEALSPALRRRALSGWSRFQANLALIRSSLISRGCNARQADQLGSLLAAGEMMANDSPIDAADAEDCAETVVPLIDAIRAEESDGSDAARCWRLLLSQRVDAWRSGEAQTVGRLLLSAQSEVGNEAQQALKTLCGMRLQLTASKSMPEAPCLYVARQHQFLRAAYRDTPWREGGWAYTLARLEGAALSKNPVRLVGPKERVVAIPMEHLPQPKAESE